MIERRAVIELRAHERHLQGYAAKFGVEARIGNFIEVIAPGAFASTLAKDRDVLALVDHDRAKVLARTKSGNLKLVEDAQGLAFDISLPKTQAASDILELVTRGDAGGASFAFTVEPSGERWTGQRRELRSVTLHEISIVSSWPAYPNTEVVARTRTPRLNLAKLYLESCK